MSKTSHAIHMSILTNNYRQEFSDVNMFDGERYDSVQKGNQSRKLETRDEAIRSMTGEEKIASLGL
jgi:hypothetical protein